MAQYIPDQYFKGVQDSTEECPLAFITPNGTDKAAEKRIATVKEWARGYKWLPPPPNVSFEVIDNPPMTGFAITKDIRRWTTSNVVWRIADPRGFELEISSGNMAYLMAETVIDHGEIMAELQWVRNGSQNFLLPTASEEYKKYTENTEILKNNITIKDLTVGDFIMLGNGDKGMYLGGYYTIEQNQFSYSDDNERNKFLKQTRRYFIKDENGVLFMRTGLKNMKIIKHGDPSDNKDWTDYINEKKGNNFIFATSKKIKIAELAKTLRFVKEGECNNDDYTLPLHSLMEFYEYNSKHYVLRHFYDNKGEAQKVTIYPDENAVELTIKPHRGYGWLDNESKLYQKAIKDGILKVMVITYNNEDYIIT